MIENRGIRTQQWFGNSPFLPYGCYAEGAIGKSGLEVSNSCLARDICKPPYDGKVGSRDFRSLKFHRRIDGISLELQGGDRTLHRREYRPLLESLLSTDNFTGSFDLSSRHLGPKRLVLDVFSNIL